MRQAIYIVSILLLLTSCNEKSKTNTDFQTTDVPTSDHEIKEQESNKEEQVIERFSFGNVSEIVAPESSSIWVEKQNNTFSLALHFRYKDTVAISYSPECWLMYPYKLENNKITVFWDTFIDTKYDFDLVKAIEKFDEKYIGKPFMVLELENDTTLHATYLLKDLVKKMNVSNKERTFYPNRFNLVQDGEMYD